MKKRLVTSLFLFAYGFSALVVQTLILREYIVQFWGSELSVSLVFFAWFSGVALGAIVFNFFRRQDEGSDFAILAFAFLLLFAGVFLSSFARVILQLPVGELAPTVKLVVAALIFVFPSGAGVGLSFPAIAKIVDKSNFVANSSSLWSALFGVEALGSLCAGILFPLVLLHLFDPMVIAALAMLFTFFCLGLFISVTKERKWGALLSLVFIISIVALALLGKSAANNLRSYIYRQVYPDQNVVAYVETPYKRLELVEKFGQFNLYADGQYSTFFPDPRHHALLANMFLCLHPNPKKILFLGGGIEGIAQIALLQPINSLEVVMLDRREVELIENYSGQASYVLRQDEKFKLSVNDYVPYVQKAAKNRTRYDLVVVFSSSPTTASSNRLYTKEFFKMLGGALSEDGVVALPILGGENYAGALTALTAASIIKTLLDSDFSEVTIIPGETLYLVASKKIGVVPRSEEELIKRYKKRGVSTLDFSPEVFVGVMPKERTAALINQIKPFMRIAKDNTDYSPIAYLFQLLFLDKVAGGNLASLIGLSKIPVKPALLEGSYKLTFDASDLAINKKKKNILPFIAAAILLICVYVLFSKKAEALKSSAVLFGIATTGLCGISFEIITLYLYQARFGVLYQNVSLLVASYMLGLTLGAFIYRIIDIAKLRSFLIIEFITALVATSPVWWRYYPPSAFGFLFALVIFGLLGGFQLALGGSILQTRYEVAGAASRVEALDHAGAMLGALVTGLFVVPILGIFWAALILALLKATSMLAVGAVYSRYRG